MDNRECFNCEFEGDKCPNNIYSQYDLKNNYKRCSPNTEFCDTSDKFEPKSPILLMDSVS